MSIQSRRPPNGRSGALTLVEVVEMRDGGEKLTEDALGVASAVRHDGNSRGRNTSGKPPRLRATGIGATPASRWGTAKISCCKLPELSIPRVSMPIIKAATSRYRYSTRIGMFCIELHRSGLWGVWLGQTKLEVFATPDLALAFILADQRTWPGSVQNSSLGLPTALAGWAQSKTLPKRA